MTDEEIRMKIAVLLGWTEVDMLVHRETGEKRGPVGRAPHAPGHHSVVPDWPNDLGEAWGLFGTVRAKSPDVYSNFLDSLESIMGLDKAAAAREIARAFLGLYDD